MSRSTLRLDIMIALVAVALVAVFAIAGCAPQQADSGSSEGTKTQTVSSEAGAYVSDEQCLSCHGGSYEALAERTADLGDWNPHDSLHGGYNACVNCTRRTKRSRSTTARTAMCTRLTKRCCTSNAVLSLP